MKANKLILITILSLLSLSVFAAGDPFAGATDKADDVIAFLTGKFAVAIVTIAIIVGAIGLLTGRGRKEVWFGIMAGGVIIGGAAGIAGWVMG